MNRALLVALALAAVGCSSKSSAGNSGDDGNEAGYPECPSLEAGAPCDVGPSMCFECENGIGFDCSCTMDSGLEAPDAAIWFCLGTGYTCH